ncbi:MAG: chitobiase/beta-hexosaminidase C-terminal domain-containing protein [Steroidobacteraceae bacterium]
MSYLPRTAPRTTSSTVYSALISVGVNESLKAIAVAPGYSASLVGTAVYKIRP